MISKKTTLMRVFKLSFLLIILFTLLSTATYTWTGLGQRGVVTATSVYVNSSVGMELSADISSERWTQQLDFTEILADIDLKLKPVTWSNEEQRFYTASFGEDGRILDIATPLEDVAHANTNEPYGHYLKLTFYARTDTPVEVSLSEAIEVAEGIEGAGTYLIGTPVWDKESLSNSNGGQDAQFAMRVGIQVNMLDRQGNPQDQEPLFYIYEPNANGHTNFGEYQGYVNTQSIDGTENLIDEEHIITQTTSSWTEVDPVQNGVVIYNLGEFEEDPYLFSLRQTQIAQINLYIWLEGQDVDCINAMGQESKILANIQFKTEAENETGLTPIY